MNLSAAFARGIPSEPFHAGMRGDVPNAAGTFGSTAVDVTATKPILQLSALPITIDRSNYVNARSDSNPNGDLRSLFAFSELVDPIPAFTRYYSPGGSSVEGTYGNIVGGAVPSDGGYVAELIGRSAATFHQGGFAKMDGTGGSWHPAYAEPADWCDPSAANRFTDLDIDLLSAGGPTDPYTILTGEDGVLLSTDAGDAPRRLSPSTTLTAISMRYLAVQITRPWLTFDLFKTQNWMLRGQPRGFCSTGGLDNNPGLMPLVPTKILLGADVNIQARYSPDDEIAIRDARAKGAKVYIGPFGIDQPSLHVIGFISELVPLSPPLNDP